MMPIPSIVSRLCKRAISAVPIQVGWGRPGNKLPSAFITTNCAIKIGKLAFHQFFRRMVPVTAYATQNRPVNKMANPKRSAGARPISIMSLANPIVLKVKKTPIREIMTVFRGTVPHTDLVIFIGYRRFGESYYSSGFLRGEQVLVRERSVTPEGKW